MSVKCFGLLPLGWTSVCSARELEGSSSSASRREAGRAHKDVRLERNRDLNSKVGEQLLPKRESCSVGKEWSLWLCSACAACALLDGSTGGSCSLRASSRPMLMDTLHGGFHTSAVHVDSPSCPLPLGDALSPAGLCWVFPLTPGSPSSPSGRSPWRLFGCSRPPSAQAALAAPHP